MWVLYIFFCKPLFRICSCFPWLTLPHPWLGSSVVLYFFRTFHLTFPRSLGYNSRGFLLGFVDQVVAWRTLGKKMSGNTSDGIIHTCVCSYNLPSWINKCVSIWSVFIMALIRGEANDFFSVSCFSKEKQLSGQSSTYLWTGFRCDSQQTWGAQKKVLELSPHRSASKINYVLNPGRLTVSQCYLVLDTDTLKWERRYYAELLT